MTVRVLIVDDERLVREALELVVGQYDDIVVVGLAGSAEEALRTARVSRPDVVLMDLRMPGRDGIEATRDITTGVAGTAVLALTTYADDATVLAALRAGAAGFLTKDSAAVHLHDAIVSVARGETALDHGAQRSVLDHLRGSPTAAPPPTPSDGPPDGLTTREAEVIGLVAAGLDNRGVARRLGVSESTVKSHLHRAYRKTGIERRGQAVIYAQRHSLT